MVLGAESILVVSGAVVALTQLCKWGRLIRDRHGPYAVLVLALVGVLVYQVSYVPIGTPVLSRTDLWPLFSAWVAVALAAAGVFGFTRSLPDAVTRTRRPPAGAAQNRTREES